MNYEDSKLKGKEKSIENNYVLENSEQTIIVKEKSHRIVVMMLILVLALILAGFGATYSYINYSKLTYMNKDIDGDSIPDLNIDTNGDGNADVNIDTNKDGKPDINIDYKGNLKSVFNIDKNGDGIADFNLINQNNNWWKNKPGYESFKPIKLSDGSACDLNCDSDKDGWPDLNIDLDGDGIPDVDIDMNGDGKSDLNLDLDGDGQCDMNCDTTGTGQCDTNCVKECTLVGEGQQSCEIVEKIVEVEKEVVKTVIIEKIVESGSSTSSGNNSIYVKGAKLVVTYADTNEINATNVFPTDQLDAEVQENKIIPEKIFTIQNTGEVSAKYNLKWIIGKNEFTSGNLKFKVAATNGGGVLNSYTSIPLNDQIFLSNISIAPGVTQTYTVSFILEGTNSEQNYDQNKTFSGRINAELVN